MGRGSESLACQKGVTVTLVECDVRIGNDERIQESIARALGDL